MHRGGVADCDDPVLFLRLRRSGNSVSSEQYIEINHVLQIDPVRGLRVVLPSVGREHAEWVHDMPKDREMGYARRDVRKRSAEYNEGQYALRRKARRMNRMCRSLHVPVL